MKLPVVVELIGGPFDGTFEFDAANPFPGGLSFPTAFGVTAYLMASSVPVGSEFTLDEPDVLRAAIQGCAVPDAASKSIQYGYRVQSRAVSESGETRVLLQHVAPKPLDVKAAGLTKVTV